MAKKSTTRRVKNPTTDVILHECALAVGQGIAAAGAINVHPAAAEFWQKRYAPFVRVARKALPWKVARTNVLTVANHLGQVAAQKSDGVTITLQNAKDATQAVLNDPACPAGGGRFCQ
ncbi:MAG TPA: hypothetical protein VGI12_19695 [Vicinamibacterales bacterium]|jgi:hypothetical protein